MSIKLAVASAILAIAIVGTGVFFFMQNNKVATEESERTSLVRDSVPTVVETVQDFEFEIVASPEARAQGLSGRADVPPGYGMLFVFDVSERYGFWMKDMLVSIDIIWLSDNGTIIGIEENVSPATYPTAFQPPVPVRLVLETRAGEAGARGWSVGTRIPLPL